MRWNELLRWTFFVVNVSVKWSVYKFLSISCVNTTCLCCSFRTFQLLVPRYIRVICSEGSHVLQPAAFVPLPPHAVTAGDLRVSLEVSTLRQSAMWRQKQEEHWRLFYGCPGTWQCTCSMVPSPVCLCQALSGMKGLVFSVCACWVSNMTRLRLDSDALLHLCCILWLSGTQRECRTRASGVYRESTHSVRKYRLSDKIRSSCTCGSGL